MKIVHLIWQFKLGGAEAMLVDIVNEQSLFEDVTLIVGNAAVEQSLVNRVSKRVQLQLLGRPIGSRNPWYLWKLVRLLRCAKADIIHAHLDSFVHLLKYARSRGVLTVHNTGIALTQQTSRYHAVYCISEAVKQDLDRRYPQLATQVIRNGIDFSAIRKKSNYGHMPFRIVQVSRLDHHQKGQDVLLRAVKKVNYFLAGSGQATVEFIGEGPSKDYLLKLRDELGLAECCRFSGLRSRAEVYEHLCSYDLLAQPSRYEGFGLTVVEAMAAGLPVLVSDVEGPMEVIDRGRHGYFFRSEDANDCAKQILEIIRLSATPEFVHDRKVAEQHAKSRYNVATTAKAYVMDYTRVLASKKLESV